jgi:hypothetical protein
MDIAGPFRRETLMNKGKQLGGKTFDTRTIIGGQVRNILPGRHSFVMALDYASQYPSQKEASNIDSSSYVDPEIIENPDLFGLEIIKKIDINDMYGPREIYYIKRKEQLL